MPFYREICQYYQASNEDDTFISYHDSLVGRCYTASSKVGYEVDAGPPGH